MDRPDHLGRTWHDLLGALTVVVLLVGLLAGPSAGTLLHSGSLETVGPAPTLTGWLQLVLEGRWGDPASAFPYPQRTLMPGPAGFWASVAWVVAVCAALAFAVARRLDATTASPTLGRRWWSLRGARPRSWARPRDLEALQVPERPTDRMVVGTIGERARLLAAEEEVHIALLAPTGSGKTSGLVVPWVLEAPGHVISLSVKPDVFQDTRQARGRRGRVWIWDPFGPESCSWSPLLGCEHWSGALRRAAWLADAGDKDDSSGAAQFWKQEGSKLLAPLLFAAAWHGLGMATVLRWLDQRDDTEPERLLVQIAKLADAQDPAVRLRMRPGLVQDAASARAQLQAIVTMDARNAGSTYMSAASLLAAYRYPEVQNTESVEDLSAEAFLDASDGQANTLYIVAGADDQARLAPIVVSILSEIMAVADRRAARHGAFSPTVRVVGDELANIAPMRSLPRWLSTMRAPGFRFAVVAQDVAQLSATFGRDDVDTILSNCRAKLFMGPITCRQTQGYVQAILGDRVVEAETVTSGERGSLQSGLTERGRASAQELQQLPRRKALLLHGAMPAAVVAVPPFWEVSSLARQVPTTTAGSGIIRLSDGQGGLGGPSGRSGVTGSGRMSGQGGRSGGVRGMSRQWVGRGRKRVRSTEAGATR